MNYNKKRLISIATKIRTNDPLTPAEADEVMSFSLETKEPTLIVWMKHWAVPLSLVLGFSLAAFAQFFDPVVEQLPPWTNLSPSMLAGVDFFLNHDGDDATNHEGRTALGEKRCCAGIIPDRVSLGGQRCAYQTEAPQKSRLH